MTAEMPAMPDTVPLKPCCGEVLANEPCDCDEFWREFAAAMSEPVIWRVIP